MFFRFLKILNIFISIRLIAELAAEICLGGQKLCKYKISVQILDFSDILNIEYLCLYTYDRKIICRNLIMEVENYKYTMLTHNLFSKNGKTTFKFVFRFFKALKAKSRFYMLYVPNTKYMNY